MVTLQLSQLRHSDSYLRGRPQMFMGLLFMHSTTMLVKIELQRGAERKETHQTSCLNTLLYIQQIIQDGPLQLGDGV